MRITLKGWQILNDKGLAKRIALTGQNSAARVINVLYDDLYRLAKEEDLPVEVLFGLVEAYLEEVNDKRGT